MHETGSILLGEILNADGGGYKGRYIEEDGYTYEFVDYRAKDVLTALGQLKVKRDGIVAQICCDMTYFFLQMKSQSSL